MFGTFFTDYQHALVEYAKSLRAMTPEEIHKWQSLVEQNGNWDYYTGGARQSSIFSLFGIKF